MKLFKRKEDVFINNKCYTVDKEVKEYIKDLERIEMELFCERKERRRLEIELDNIKPILNSKDYKPAISKDCGDCKYVVKTKCSGYVIGCRKDNLCDNFVPVE